jgi:hypothetical protein
VWVDSVAKVKEMKERRGGGGESLVLKCLPLGLLSGDEVFVDSEHIHLAGLQVIIPWSLGLWIVACVNRRCGAAPHSATNL